MSLCFCLFSFRFIYSFSLTEFGSLFFDVSPLFFVYSFFSVSFTSSMLFSRSLIPLTNVKIVILFYLLSLLFYLISLMLFLFLFFPQSFFILSITLFLFFFYFLFSILFIWSLRIVIFVFLSSCPPAFFVLFYLPCPCFSLPLLPTHNFDFALCGPSRFGYDTTTTTTSGSQFRYYVACDEWYTELLEQTLHVPTTNNGTQLYQWQSGYKFHRIS